MVRANAKENPLNAKLDAAPVVIGRIGQIRQ